MGYQMKTEKAVIDNKNTQESGRNYKIRKAYCAFDIALIPSYH